MCDLNHPRLRQQVRFRRRQFLQEGDLPFTDVLSETTIAPALDAIEACWNDRIYTPLVTLWVTCSMPWHLLRAYRGIRRATLTLPDFERHLGRTVLHRRYLNAARPFVISLSQHAAFAKDIDTRAELEELVALSPCLAR